MELLHLTEHPDPGNQGVFVHFKADMALSGLLRLLFPPVQPQGVARDHVFHRVPLLPGLLKLLHRGGRLRRRRRLPPVQLTELLTHRPVPVHHLLGGGGQSGQQGLGLMGVGRFDRLHPPQLLQFPGQSPRRAQGLLGGGVLLLRLSPGLFQLFIDRSQPGAPCSAIWPERLSCRPSRCSSSSRMRAVFSRLCWMLLFSTAMEDSSSRTVASLP